MLTSNSSIVQYSPDFDKLDMSAYPAVVIDAEWRGNTFLTKQMTFTDAALTPKITVVLWNESYSLPTAFPALDHPLVVIKCPPNITMTDSITTAKTLRCVMFYSPKDLTAVFGEVKMTELYAAKDIKKLRNVSGKFEIGGTKVTIQDTLGMFNSSLESGLESVGIDTKKSKTLAKGRDKSRMDLWIKEDPNSFIAYAVGDTVLLAEAVQKRVEQINLILNSTFPKYQLGNYTTDTIKYSSGSLVNDVFVRWFAHEYPDIFRVQLKQSTANCNKSWYELGLQKEKIEGVKNPIDLIESSNSLRYSQIAHGMSAGGIKGIGITALNNTGIFGTVVQGGRCINEEPKLNPYDCVIDNVIDGDLSSCYGTALRDFDYPVGIPTIYGKKKDDDVILLGDFLKLHETDLVDGLYAIYISGTLKKSSQDLVHSKYELTTSKLASKLLGILKGENAEASSFDGWGREIEAAHMGGNFILTKKQIELGVITADVLKTLRSVATPQELADWMTNMVVEAAIYYPKSLELSNDDWVAKVEYNLGKDTVSGDNRNRSWSRIPLSGFIGGFIKYRKEVKKQVVKKGDTFDLLQNSVKLFINTTYGCLAAPYFEMGNTILANNITAKARTGVWMYSKAVLSVQSITDGGMFGGSRVAVIGRKLPSMSTLANRQRYLKHDGRLKTKVLFSTKERDCLTSLVYENTELLPIDEQKPRQLFIKTETTKADKKVQNHVNDFWSNWSLELPFDIECKWENAGTKAAYFGSSDYAIDISSYSSKGTILKVRGAKQKDHPKQLFLKHILEPTVCPIPVPKYEYQELIGINDYLKNPYSFQGLLPGDDYTTTTYHRPFKNGQTFDTYAEYETFERNKTKLEKEYDKTDKTKRYGLALMMSEGYKKLPASLQTEGK